jgi:hypothetical protein
MSMGYLKNVAKDCFSKKEFDDFIFMGDVRRACWHVSGKLKYLQLPRYMPWTEEKMFSVIKEKLNWGGQQLWQEHMDCVMSDAKEYCRWKKLGVTEKIFKVSSLIRDGQIDRQKAFEIVEKQKNELVENEPLIREKIMSRFGISEEELDAALKKDHLQYISSGDRILLWMKEKFYK